METSDFLQADDIFKVFMVPFAIAEGKASDNDIEEFIGLNSSGRQGRYYRLAAETFKLIKTSNNMSSLTPEGEAFIALADTNKRLLYIRDILPGTPVFCEGIQYLETIPKPSRSDLKKWFITQYPGSENTAERRFSSFENYLKETDYL